MGYLKKTWHCRNGSQVMEYHSRKFHPPGEKRKPRQNKTSKRQEEANQRAKSMRIQRLILENFGEGDKWITLTFKPGEDPEGREECMKERQKLLRWMKRQYQGFGEDLRWMSNMEKTRRGIWHIHLLVNNVPGTDVGKMVRKWWKERHGSISRIQDTYLDGGFAKLADYMAKTERNEETGRESFFSRSRNLREPSPEVKEYKRNAVLAAGGWKDIKVPKGMELVKESVYEGIDECTGYPYRYYTLIRSGGSDVQNTHIPDVRQKRIRAGKEKIPLHDHGRP